MSQLPVPKMTMFGLEDLKNDRVQTIITDKVKGAITDLMPDELWQPMVAVAVESMFSFKLYFKRHDRSFYGQEIEHYHYTENEDGEEVAEQQKFTQKDEFYTTFITYEDYLKYKALKDKIYYHLHAPERRMNLDDLPFKERLKFKAVRDADGKPRKQPLHTYRNLTVIRDESDVDYAYWRIEKIENSAFFDAITKATHVEGGKLIEKTVAEYFTGNDYDGHRIKPTDILKKAVEAQLPTLMQTFFETQMAESMHNFSMHLRNDLRNGSYR